MAYAGYTVGYLVICFVSVTIVEEALECWPGSENCCPWLEMWWMHCFADETNFCQESKLFERITW